jgi:predicted dienelactone hydrolase
MRKLVSVAVVSLAVTVPAVMAGAARGEKRPAAAIRVGVTLRVFHPTAVRNWRGDEQKDLRCVVWYPAVDTAVEVRQVVGPPDAPWFESGVASPNAGLAPSLSGWPLILLSHGTGGSAIQLAWLGTALARAGFIAVAVDHPGNNSNATLTAEGFALWWERATDLSQVLDGMLADAEFGKRIDQSRIAAAGFSIGGFTVLELAGARTDISVLYNLCREKADMAGCMVPEMRNLPDDEKTTEGILHAVRKTSGESLARSGDLFSDARIGAVFAMAPALGFTQTAESLRRIRLPVEMVVGDEDTIAPAKDNAGYVRSEVRGARLTVLPHVRHYTFLDTCTTDGKQKLGQICEDDKEIDRDAVHAQVAGMAAGFFERALKIK